MRNVLFIILLCLSISGFSQNSVFDLAWNNEKCKHSAETFSVIFANYLRENNADSAKAVLNRWEQNCNSSEPVQRAKIIFALSTGSFSENIYYENILESIINFDSRLLFSQQSDPGLYYSTYQTYFGFIPFNSYFDQVIYETAKDLTKTFGKYTCEDLFTKLYSNQPDSFFIQLQNPATDGTLLKTLYQKEVNNLLRKPGGFAAFYLGTLIPARQNTILGIHPVIGAKIGIKQRKIAYNLILEGRFGDTKQEYTYNLKDKDSLVFTNEYLGALMGLEFGYELFKRKSYEIDFVCGGGYEILRTMLYPEDYTNDVTINTFNGNIGLSIKKYISSSVYLDLTAKYNYTDYTLKNQSDLNENYFSVTLQLGYFGNRGRDARLNKLKYR